MKKYFLFDEQKAKEAVALIVEKSAGFVAKEAPEGSVKFRIIITDETEDRMGEVIKLAGWKTENYLKNPVVLLNHDYHALPIGITTDLTIEDGKMIAQGYFAPAEANPLAAQAAKAYELGLLRTASVGFIPKYSETEKQVIESAELLEWSFVSVPANPNALSLLGAEYADYVSKGIIQEAKEGKKMESEERAGRVLSKKNRTIITETVAKLTEVQTALTALLDLEDEKSEGEDGRKKQNDSEEFVSALLGNRKAMKQIASVVNDALAKMNGVFNK